MSLFIFITLTCLLVCFSVALVTRVFIQVGIKRRWLIYPKSQRWHINPVVGYGGVCIYVPFALILLFVFLILTHEQTELQPSILASYSAFPTLLASSFILFLGGLFDDIRALSPFVKICIQLLATTLFFVYGGGICPFTGKLLPDVLLSAVWLLGTTNGINLLDNADGLASSTCITICFGVFLLYLVTGVVTTLGSILCLLLASALSGFWIFNKPPARIFMGDTGSLPIGFILGSITLPSMVNLFFLAKMSEFNSLSLNHLLLPLLCLAAPLFDTTFVTLSRCWVGCSPLRGGTDHVSHRLLILGLSETQMLWAFFLLSLSGILLSLILTRYPNLIFLCMGMIGGVLLGAGVILFRTTESRVKQMRSGSQV